MNPLHVADEYIAYGSEMSLRAEGLITLAAIMQDSPEFQQIERMGRYVRLLPRLFARRLINPFARCCAYEGVQIDR